MSLYFNEYCDPNLSSDNHSEADSPKADSPKAEQKPQAGWFGWSDEQPKKKMEGFGSQEAVIEGSKGWLPSFWRREAVPTPLEQKFQAAVAASALPEGAKAEIADLVEYVMRCPMNRPDLARMLQRGLLEEEKFDLCLTVVEELQARHLTSLSSVVAMEDPTVQSSLLERSLTDPRVARLMSSFGLVAPTPFVFSNACQAPEPQSPCLAPEPEGLDLLGLDLGTEDRPGECEPTNPFDAPPVNPFDEREANPFGETPWSSFDRPQAPPSSPRQDPLAASDPSPLGALFASQDPLASLEPLASLVTPGRALPSGSVPLLAPPRGPRSPAVVSPELAMEPMPSVAFAKLGGPDSWEETFQKGFPTLSIPTPQTESREKTADRMSVLDQALMEAPIEEPKKDDFAFVSDHLGTMFRL